jgi:hypothetical protein
MEEREGRESAPLSLEEFTKLTEMGKPRYNNFWFFFIKRDLIGSKLYEDPFLDEGEEEEEDEKKQKELCKRCYGILEKENPDLERRLREGIQACKALLEGEEKEQLNALKDFEKDLYEAYKIMKKGGATDDELFS